MDGTVPECFDVVGFFVCGCVISGGEGEGSEALRGLVIIATDGEDF